MTEGAEPRPDSLVGDDELVRLLLNSTGEGIYGIDLKGECTFANPACVRLLGFDSDQELLGVHMHNLVHHHRPDGSPYPEKECRIYKAFREGTGTHVDDEVMFRKDGSSFPAEYWSYPVEHDGKLVGCVLTFLDITERRQAMQELRAANQLVRMLLDSTGEGIYGIDLKGECTFANPACVRLLGFESDQDLLGQHMHNLVHHHRPDGTEYPEKECRIYKAFREGVGVHVDDEVMFRKDGSEFPAEYWSYPLEREGELVGCVLTFVDITDRRRVEEELRQTEKMAALGKLSAGLAHEINNPAAAAMRAGSQLSESLDSLQACTLALCQSGAGPGQIEAFLTRAAGIAERADTTPVLSPLDASDREEDFLQWLEDRDVPDPWDLAPILVHAGVEPVDLEGIETDVGKAGLRHAVPWLSVALDLHSLAGTVTRSTKSIAELVGVVKSYSHMDRAPAEIVDVHQGIEDTLRILQHKLRKGVEVIREFDLQVPKVLTRGGELNQVWTNLIDNAIGAMDGLGTIRIRTLRVEDHIAVDIIDDGPGIPPDIQKRIFDPFFTTKGVGDGTGLGLDVVRRIVTGRCGGKIDVTSRPGETRFRVMLLPDNSCEAEAT
jgi:PAS domain S-box-containing protein